MIKISPILLCALVLFAPSGSRAQYFWKQTNVLEGQGIDALGVDSNGNIFASVWGLFLWRSPDNGNTWKIDSAGFIDSTGQTRAGYLSWISIKPNGEIFTGAGYEYSGGGIYTSINGSKWRYIDSGLKTQSTAPINFETFVFSAAGNLFVGCVGHGVFRSGDDGVSWQRVNIGLSDTAIFSLTIAKNGNIFAGGAFGDVYISSDEGDHWTQSKSSGALCRVLTLATNASGNIFAGTDSLGIFRSTNNGSSWSAINTGLPQKTPVHSIAIDGRGNVFAATHSGVFLSSNNGNSWSAVSTGMPSKSVVYALAISPDGHIFAGTGGNGVFRSTAPTFAVAESNETQFDLAPAVPNPFSRSTAISFSLSKTGYASIHLYNATGHEVAALANGFFDAGEHYITFDIGNLPDGVYFYRLEANGESQTRSFVVMR